MKILIIQRIEKQQQKHFKHRADKIKLRKPNQKLKKLVDNPKNHPVFDKTNRFLVF
jgi:hypothetical protein